MLRHNSLNFPLSRSTIAGQIVDLVPHWFDGVPFLEASGDYFINGSFDPLDILAAPFGASVA